MTKKHFLLLIAFLFAIQLDAMKYKVHIYKLCDGVRTHLVTKSDDNDFHFRIDDCINICTDCDLEIVYETNNEDQLTTTPYLTYTYDGNAPNVITGILYEEEIYNDGKKYLIGQIDLSSITSMVTNGYILVHGNYVLFNCLKIDPSNNKDDIGITDKEICLTDCFYLKDLIKNNEIIDPLSGNTVMKANPDKDWFKIGDEDVYRGFEGSVLHKLYCPTKPGKFEIKTTVKDACGEKEISGFLTVKDCTPFNNCEQCCGNFLNFANEMRTKGLPPLKQVGSLYINEYEESFFKCEYSISLLIECQGGNSNNILLKPNDSYMLPPGCKIKGYCIIPKDRCVECEMCFEL